MIPAANKNQVNTFTVACEHMSVALVQDLADKVPPEHLTQEARQDACRISPMHAAAVRDNTPDGIAKVMMLVLRGVPVRQVDFLERYTESITEGTGSSRRRSRITKIIHRPCRRLPGLLAWANAELAAHRTYDDLVIGCGIHCRRNLPPAQRSHLVKLRGDGNTDARMRFARCLGVRTGAELGRLRRAEAEWLRVRGSVFDVRANPIYL